MFRSRAKDNSEYVVSIQGSRARSTFSNIASVLFQNFDDDSSKRYDMAKITVRDHYGNSNLDGFGDIVFETRPDDSSNLYHRMSILNNGTLVLGDSNIIPQFFDDVGSNVSVRMDVDGSARLQDGVYLPSVRFTAPFASTFSDSTLAYDADANNVKLSSPEVVMSTPLVSLEGRMTSSDAGSAASPTYGWNVNGGSGSGSGTGAFFVGDSNSAAIAWSTGAQERMRVDDRGNLGINVEDPTVRLDVDGVVRSSDRMIASRYYAADPDDATILREPDPLHTLGADTGCVDGSAPPVGTLLTFATDQSSSNVFTVFPPDTFLRADGSTVDRSEYGQLFDVVGTYYGTGDGSGTTFSLPTFSPPATQSGSGLIAFVSSLPRSVPVGAIVDYATDSSSNSTPQIPCSFLRADGSAVSRAEYKALFSVIGTYYGEGDGQYTFGLPDVPLTVVEQSETQEGGETQDGGSTPVKEYLYTASADQRAIKVDPDDMSSVLIYTGHSGAVWSAVFGADSEADGGGFLYTGSSDTDVHKVNAETMTQEAVYTGAIDQVWSLMFAANGFVYAGLGNGQIHKIDPVTMTQAEMRSVHTNRVISLIYVASIGGILSGSFDGTIKLSAAGDLSALQSFSSVGSTWALAIDPNDETVFYSGGDVGRVIKHSTSDLSELDSFEDHSSRIEDLHFGSDGFLYTCSLDETARKLAVADMSEVGAYNGLATRPVTVRQGSGGRVYISGDSAVVHQLDTSDMTFVAAFTGHTAQVGALALTVTGSGTGTGTGTGTEDPNVTEKNMVPLITAREREIPPGTVIGVAKDMNATTIEVPVGFLRADGSEVNRAQFADLFEVTGTYYGDGDGVDTFNLPDASSLLDDFAYFVKAVSGASTHRAGAVMLVDSFTDSSVTKAPTADALNRSHSELSGRIDVLEGGSGGGGDGGGSGGWASWDLQILSSNVESVSVNVTTSDYSVVGETVRLHYDLGFTVLSNADSIECSLPQDVATVASSARQLCSYVKAEGINSVVNKYGRVVKVPTGGSCSGTASVAEAGDTFFLNLDNFLPGDWTATGSLVYRTTTTT
jgi:microcystin-dependent protein